MYFACVLHGLRVKATTHSPDTGAELVHHDDSPCGSISFIAHFDTRVPRDMAAVSLRLMTPEPEEVVLSEHQ